MIIHYYIIGLAFTLLLSLAQNHIWRENRPLTVDFIIACLWALAIPLVIINVCWDLWYEDHQPLVFTEAHGRGGIVLNV